MSSSPPVAPVRFRNEAAGTAVVLAVLALIGALVPVLDLFTGILAVLGAVFGILALTRKRRHNSRRLAITGLVLNVVALTAWAIAITTMVGLVLDTYPSPPPETASRPVPTTPGPPELVYPVPLTVELTGSAPDVRALWWGALVGEDTDLAPIALPDTREHDVFLTEAAFEDEHTFAITAVVGEAGGTVSCRLTSGDILLSYDTASGADGTVVCGIAAFGMIERGVTEGPWATGEPGEPGEPQDPGKPGDPGAGEPGE